MPRLRALALVLGIACLAPAGGVFEDDLFAGGAGGQRCGSCPAPWHAWGGYCYRLTEPMAWVPAGEACRRLGAAMAVPHSWAENDFVWRLGEDRSPVFIDCHDREEEGTWVCGNFTHWKEDEPNNAVGEEDCAVIRENDNGRWMDVPCNYTYPAVCRRDCVPMFCFTANEDGRLE